jgi:hypothetical protein
LVEHAIFSLLLFKRFRALHEGGKRSDAIDADDLIERTGGQLE